LQGDILAGGTFSATAERGYVITAPTAIVDVSGAQGLLDLPSAQGLTRRESVSSAGGSISFGAAEGMQLYATLRAAGGAPTVAGGSLALTFDASATPGNRTALNDPISDRTLFITTNNAPTVIGLGAAVPAGLNGLARMPAASINQGGFDSLTLRSRNLVDSVPILETPFVAGFGIVQFDAGVSLAPRARLFIDAPGIAIAGAGEARLAASYVALGTLDNTQIIGAPMGNTPPATGGAGRLTVAGNLIELTGVASVRGAGTVSLDSAGDIRARGVYQPSTSDYRGAFSVADALRISAQQLYPTTLTNYTLTAGGVDRGSIDIVRAAGVASTVLSARGGLTLEAGTVRNAGTVVAPFGEIAVRGRAIENLAGGEFSVSSRGATIPFGTAQGGFDWAYGLSTVDTRIFDPALDPLIDSRVRFEGESVVLAPGSRVDLSGGGDLLAYEWIPGPGGTRDVLDAQASPSLFAVVPGLSLNFLAFDPRELRGSTLRAGDRVQLADGSRLPAGEYTLLPARYALLPGSFLVQSVSGFQDISAGTSIVQLDGSVVVSGRRSVFGTDIADSRSSGFVVRPGAEAQQLARYDVFTADNFFAARVDGPTPQRPRDASTATISATRVLDLQGSLIAATPTGGRGGTIELTSERLRVVGASAPVRPGFVDVASDSINRLGAARVVIGGSFSQGTTASELTATSAEVLVDAGARLQAPDVVLVARDEVRVARGAEVRTPDARAPASNGAEESWLVSSGASLIRTSSGGAVDVGRLATGAGAGRLVIESGSTLAASGALVVDAGTTARTDGTLLARGADVTLGAPRIALGNAPEAFGGIALDAAELQGLGARSIDLRARDGLSFFAGASLTADLLSVRTPLLQAEAGASNVTLAARELTLAGALTPVSASGGAAQLALTADTIFLDAGTVATRGFSLTSLNSRGAIVGVESGALTAGGDLELRAAAIAGTDGVDRGFVAADRLVLATNGDAVPGAQIVGATRIVAPSGRIALSATGPTGVRLDGPSLLDVSGRETSFDGVPVRTAGGRIDINVPNGDISLANGTVLDVSAAGAGDAGTASLVAPQGRVVVDGTLRGASATAGRGGSLAVVADAF
jgi:filamentous hemagglutinin